MYHDYLMFVLSSLPLLSQPKLNSLRSTAFVSLPNQAFILRVAYDSARYGISYLSYLLYFSRCLRDFFKAVRLFIRGTSEA